MFAVSCRGGLGMVSRQSKLGHSSSGASLTLILTSSGAVLSMLRCHITASVASPFIQTMAYFQTMIRRRGALSRRFPTVLVLLYFLW